MSGELMESGSGSCSKEAGYRELYIDHEIRSPSHTQIHYTHTKVYSHSPVTEENGIEGSMD